MEPGQAEAATASLSPSPSGVTFRAEGNVWHRFTVSPDREIVVVANPTGSARQLELTLANQSERRNICPGEWNEVRNRTKWQSVLARRVRSRYRHSRTPRRCGRLRDPDLHIHRARSAGGYRDAHAGTHRNTHAYAYTHAYTYTGSHRDGYSHAWVGRCVALAGPVNGELPAKVRSTS